IYRLRLRTAADHVEMHRRLDPRRDLRLAVEQRQRALDLRREDEADRAPRRLEALLVDQLRKRPRDLEDRRAAAGVVVRARARMIEVATEDDLLAAQLSTGNRRRRDLV